MTLSVLYCLFVILLTMCMDVEKNPGPDENFVTLMQNVDWRFSQIMQGIQMHTAHINSTMDDVDYCVELLLFVLVLCKTTLPPTTETERTLIKSFNFEDSLQSLYA